MRRKPEIRIILALIFIIALILSVYFVTRYFLKTSTIKTLGEEQKKDLVCLVVGVDNEDISKGRTDTIFLLFYNFNTKKVFLYSIPRDLRVKVFNSQPAAYDKINHIYYKYDILTLKNTVESLLDLSIPYYTVIKYDAISSLVDILGGVKIYVEQDMNYTDKSGGLYINLKKGIQVLDGEKTLEYLRFRSDEEGDLGRINRQISFISVIFQRKADFMKLSLVDEIIKILFKKIRTNFTITDINLMIKEFEKTDISKFYYDILLTKPIRISGVDYLEPLQKGIYDKERIKSIFSFIQKKEGEWKKRIRVEIKNGSNKTGMAKLLRNKLIYYNIDVIYFGNADSTYKDTIVIDRTGNLNFAKDVALILKSNNLYTDKDLNLGVDVTIIIGEDFNIDNVD